MTKIDDDDDDLQPAPEEIKPRASGLTITLCVLNVLAVLACAFLLLMDLSRRAAWQYLIFRHDLAIVGLPLEDERSGFSDAHTLASQPTLDPDWLKAAYAKRQGKAVTEKFREAKLEMQIIRPQQLESLAPKELASLFKDGGGEPVKTQDEEIADLKKKLPGKIADAALAVKDQVKAPQDRRDRLKQELFSLAATTDQVDALDTAIAKVGAGDLGDLLADALQRRLIVDILDVMEEFRPWHPQKEGGKEDDKAAADFLLRRVVALDKAGGALTAKRYTVTIDDLNAELTKRLDSVVAAEDPVSKQKRQGLEKRRSTAFLLFALSRVKVPDPGDATKLKPLYPPERAEIISGTREFAQAADSMALVLGHVEKRLLTAIDRDLGQHYVYPVGDRITKPTAFADKLSAVLTRVYLTVFRDQAKKEFGKPFAKDWTADEVLSKTEGLLAALKLKIPDAKEFADANKARAKATVDIDAELKRQIVHTRGDMKVFPNPEPLVAAVTAALDGMKVQLTNDKAIRDEVAKHFTDQQGKFKTAEQVLNGVKDVPGEKDVPGVKDVLGKLGVVIPESDPKFKANAAAFDFEVARLADDRETGFVGRHHEGLKRIQDIIKLIEDQDRRLKEVEAQETESKRQLDERKTQVAETTARLIGEREKSLRMATNLRRLQDELFRAQIELADADRRNQLYERRIRVLELARRGGKR